MFENGLMKINPNLPGNFKSSRDMQRFIIQRKFAKGFQFTTKVGAQSFQSFQFPGTAFLMLGLTMFDTSKNPLNIFTLSINNEDVISESSWVEYTKVLQFPAAGLATGTSFNGEFYEYPRPLSGKDSLKLTYTAATAGTLLMNFYFTSEQA